MPCYDAEARSETYAALKRAEARLCAVFRVLEQRGELHLTLSAADWKESGVSGESTFKWWKEHKEADRQRRTAEAKLREEKQKKREALARISEADKKLLGLK